MPAQPDLTIDDLIARWNTGDGKPYKGSLIDMNAYEADPTNMGCMCAQGQVLHLVRKMSAQEIADLADQRVADDLVMETLGISRGQAILLRQINDKVDGAPSIVLTHPEKVIGEHAQIVLAFFKYLDAMTAEDWQKYFAARAAARAAAGDAAWAAAGAAHEIQGHKILAAKGKPPFFLSLFGFKTIEALIDWASA